jgi:uncharacterized protein (TIGR00251 family)
MDMDLPHVRVKDGIVIDVKVHPRSSRKEIAGVTGGRLTVRLTAPPVGGAANEQLIEVLSEYFGIRKSDVIILKGETSRNKRVKLAGVNP